MFHPGTESEWDWSQGASLCWYTMVLWKQGGRLWVILALLKPSSAHSGWWRLKRSANSGHKTRRLNCHFHAVSKKWKALPFSSVTSSCRDQPLTPSFPLAYINLSSLLCHYISWDLMYLPLLLSLSLPLPFYWYHAVLASISICPSWHMSDGQSAVSKTYHLSSGVLDH